MKYLLFSMILLTKLLASAINISTFQADFIQTITDDKGKVLTYKGNIVASDTQDALWSYTYPLHKFVYLNQNKVTIVEPEIEQVIIRYIKSNFNFFNMLKNANKVDKDRYITSFNNAKFTIDIKNEKISSISYLDEFENKVNISFLNQKENIKLDNRIFLPKYDPEFDLIEE